MRIKKQTAGLMVTVMLALVGQMGEPVLSAYAAEPGETAIDETEETVVLANLQDTMLEYGEIQDMIHYYNPSIQAVMASYEENINDYESIRQSLRDGRDQADWGMDRARDNGEEEEYAYYAAEKETFRAGISSYKKAIDRLKRSSNLADERRMERQLTMAAQSLVVSYESIREQEALTEKTQELYVQQYQTVIIKQQKGLAGQADVLETEKKMAGVKASLKELQTRKSQIYNSICIMVGVSPDAGLTICSFPDPDITWIDAIDLEADTHKAIGNNYPLIDNRHSLESNSTPSRNRKIRTLDEGEEQVTIEMKKLYQTLLLNRKALETAEKSLQQTIQKKQIADIQFSQGLISQETYLSTQLEYLQGLSDYQSSKLNMIQAMDAYRWAVLGIL